MTDLKKTGIYRIINTSNNYIYIGSASGKFGIHQRFQDHKKNLRKKSHHNIYLQRSWDKHGEDMFRFEIVEFCHKSECIEREQFFIDTLSPEYNICKVAGNTLGLNCEDFMSPQAIKNKRAKQSLNISKALIGKKKSEAHAIKCGAKFFNVYEAICIITRKRGQSAMYIKGKYVKRWLKREECAKELNISSKLIRRCLQGKRQQTHNYIFEYEAT